MRTLRLQELESIAVAGVHWKPLRRELGITAFRTNAYAADAGEQLIEEHTEDDEEEMYVLISGAATFVVDGEEIAATPGTVVFLPEPGARRSATATEDGTLALAVGDVAGRAGPPSAWEHRFAARPHIEAGDYERAHAVASAALDDHPDDAGTHYDLACIKALAGEREKALEHWRRAVELNPRARKWAEDDPELDAIRDAL